MRAKPGLTTSCIPDKIAGNTITRQTAHPATWPLCKQLPQRPDRLCKAIRTASGQASKTFSFLFPFPRSPSQAWQFCPCDNPHHPQDLPRPGRKRDDNFQPRSLARTTCLYRPLLTATARRAQQHAVAITQSQHRGAACRAPRSWAPAADVISVSALAHLCCLNSVPHGGCPCPHIESLMIHVPCMRSAAIAQYIKAGT